MRRAIVLMLDGLRPDFVTFELMPILASRLGSFETFTAHRSVFPSTTRVVSASFATGCFPERHGLRGNTIALHENKGLTRHDVGRPEFFENWRRITGRTLRVPTMAQRLAECGESIVFNNVSPGACYAHDPDGYGFCYHRAGSFAPGRRPIPASDALGIAADAAGDVAMTERFCAEVIEGRRPALGVLWLGEPDRTQHIAPLGSPAHHAALAVADDCVRAVWESCERVCQRTDDDLLLIVGSDHGHQTVVRSVDIDSVLVSVGLKADQNSSDVVVAANGTAALLYIDAEAASRRSTIEQFLREQDWAGEIRSEVGDLKGSPAFLISMREHEGVNEFGVAGLSDAALAPGKVAQVGFGQHGGLGHYEQSPMLMIRGPGFSPARERAAETSIVDIAPTVMRHLELATSGMQGRPLQWA